MPFHIREKINLALYDSREKALTRLRLLSFIVSMIAIGTLTYYHGFSLDRSSKEGLLVIIKASLAFYIVRYFLRYLYSLDWRKFIKQTWFEGLLMLLLLVDGIGDVLFGTTLERAIFNNLGIDTFTSFYVLFIQLYLLIIVALEIGRTSNFLPRIKVHPSNLFLLSFLIIILAGTLLLMLPEATVSPGSMQFTNALFTATSAATVTGLIVVDTATFFTVKGQLIILALIQLGALNTIAFGLFFALFSKFGIGMSQHEVTEDFFGGQKSRFNSKSLLGKIILWSIVIEVAGAFLIYTFWNVNVPFQDQGDKIFSSVFHSISAFNNAGFSLFTDGFYNDEVNSNYLLHAPIIALMFLGTLGFLPLLDMYSLSKIKERLKNPWKQIEFSTKIGLYFSLGLILFGAVSFFFLEYSNTLSNQTFIQSITTSLFQSISARNIGFNTVDIQQCTIPMLIIFLFLMFVGAGSASSGGGIRTSSFALLCATVISTVRGKNDVELFKRTIPHDLALKAFAIVLFFAVGIGIESILLTITESHILESEGRGFMDILFESVSAFTTTGLTMGITSELSEMGKYIEIACMYIGRVGTLTIAYLLAREGIKATYRYAEGQTLIG